MEQWMIMIELFMTGAVTGSFIGVVIERYPPGADGHEWIARISWSVSRCQNCQAKLGITELIPLYSWLRLQGRCRYCQHPVPVFLFFSELFTAVLFVLLAMITLHFYLFLGLALFSCTLFVLSEIDRRHLLLPDALTLPLIWGGLLFHLQLLPVSLPQSLLGAIVGYLTFWGISATYYCLYKQAGLGLGDAKLFAALGAWAGLSALPLIATLAATLGLINVLWRRIRRRKAIHQPFGPCLSVAGWLVLLAQHSKIDWLTTLV